MKIFSKTLIILIKCYQLVISPYIGNNCRYLPTCSEYFIDCVEEFGILKGTYRGIKRILCCHPWSEGGFDPIKKKMKVDK